MKTKILLTTLFVFLVYKPIYSQTYSPVDSAALRAIDASCDTSNQLNWDSETNLGNWIGVTWNDSIPKRVKYLQINSKLLTGTMNISSLEDMLELWVNNNSLTGLTFSGLTHLTRIMCRYNQLTKLDISTLLKLKELYCNNNQIDSIDASSAVELQYVTCNDNQMVSLNLSNLTKLEELYCYNNLLDTLVLTDNTSLRIINCSNNLLDTLVGTDNTILRTIYCFNNQLAHLDLSSLTSLLVLDCHINQLTSLHVSGLINLEALFCGNNKLDSLELSGLKNLLYLDCSHNQFTSLDLSSLPLLLDLNCVYNKLTSLNLSPLDSLRALYCSYNLFTSLDLSVVPKLVNLQCENNQLTNLDVSSLKILTVLVCENNQLTRLDVSSLDSLIYLDCSYNKLTSLGILPPLIENLSVIYNKLPFSSLVTGLNVSGYYYIPQDTIFGPITIAGTYTIDYSAEALIRDTATTFIFYKDAVPVDTNTTGVYSTTGPGVYNCTMMNAVFPGLILTTAKITISGDTPALSVSPSILDVSDTANSTGIIHITSNTAWNVSSSETWLTLSDTSGMLNDSVIVTTTANPDTTLRSAIITISGVGVTSKTVTVNQAAKPYLLVSVLSLPVNAAANSTATFDITSNTSWTVSSSQTWLTANPTSGSDSRKITLTATANLSPLQRFAVISVSGTGVTSKNISIAQAGATSEISIANKLNITVYPCPVIDVLKVKLSQEDLPAVISIYTLEGKQIVQLKISSTITDIDFTKYSSGIYIIRIVTSENTIEKKIIKK